MTEYLKLLKKNSIRNFCFRFGYWPRYRQRNICEVDYVSVALSGKMASSVRFYLKNVPEKGSNGINCRWLGILSEAFS